MDLVAIGDSLIAGHPANYTTREGGGPSADNLVNRLALFRGWTSINQGIGSQTSTDVAGRFAADVVANVPTYALIQGGVNDIAGGSISQATFIANYTSMLNSCQSNNIKAIVMAILPWTNGTTGQMQKRETWNAALAALVATYANTWYIDPSSLAGKFRTGGDAGNYWDIRSEYAADGVHYSVSGYGAIAVAIYVAMAGK